MCYNVKSFIYKWKKSEAKSDSVGCELSSSHRVVADIEIDRASRAENRGLPTRPTQIRYKVDYANAHRTAADDEETGGRR